MMESDYVDEDAVIGVGGYMLGEPVDSANSTDDDCPHWVPSDAWWTDVCEPLGLDNLECNGNHTNDIQSECFPQISHTSHEGVFHKCYSSSHNFVPPHQGDGLIAPHTNNERPHGLGACGAWISYPPRHCAGSTILQDSDRSQWYRDQPIYEHPDFMLDMQQLQQIPEFAGSFGNSNDLATQPPPCFSQFTSADLGTLSQTPNADGTASCNSECVSSVCDLDNCPESGVPCDDPSCVNISLAQVPDLTTHLPTQIASVTLPFHQPHSQPCNHTESEHLAAKTLGELRAPAELHAREKTPFTFHSDTLASRAGEQVYNRNYESYLSSPPQLTTEIKSPGSSDSHMRLQSTPSLPTPTPYDRVNHPDKLICQWTANTDPNVGQGEICGAEFTNTKDFHDHLCEFHIGKMTGQPGYACLWAGCPRKQDNPFVTRGKLRRHISTHSIYKPFACQICHQRFSGHQALQQHERIHTGDKPYKCTFEDCTMAFKQKSALTMHLRTHTGEKPLRCEICGKAFPESSNLSKHRKIHAVKSDKFICDDIVKGQPCGRSFRRLDQLRRHRETHKPGKRKMAHSRSKSTVSEEVLHFKPLPDIPAGKPQ